MRKVMTVLLTGAIMMTLAVSVQASSHTTAPGESFIGLSIFNPVQYPDESFSIRGIRINALYAVNEDLTGIDYGLIFPFNYLRGNMSGVQLGLYNEVGNKTTGLQWGLVNQTKGDVSGVQLGLVNFSGAYHRGIQSGFYNQADHISGLQLGVLNQTRSLHGVQVGLLNLKEEVGPGMPHSMPMRGFPIVNWTF